MDSNIPLGSSFEIFAPPRGKTTEAFLADMLMLLVLLGAKMGGGREAGFEVAGGLPVGCCQGRFR